MEAWRCTEPCPTLKFLYWGETRAVLRGLLDRLRRASNFLSSGFTLEIDFIQTGLSIEIYLSVMMTPFPLHFIVKVTTLRHSDLAFFLHSFSISRRSLLTSP